MPAQLGQAGVQHDGAAHEVQPQAGAQQAERETEATADSSEMEEAAVVFWRPPSPRG